MRDPTLDQAAYREAKRKGLTCWQCEHWTINRKKNEAECAEGNHERFGPTGLCGAFEFEPGTTDGMGE